MLGPFICVNGTEAAPGLAFLGSISTGLYYDSTEDDLVITVQGTEVLRFKDDGTVIGSVALHAIAHAAGGQDELPHDTLEGAGAYSHAQIDEHIDDMANPHGVTAVQTGADPAGTADAAVAAHVAEADPHVQYVQKGVTSELEVGYTLDSAPALATDAITPDFAVKMLQQWQPPGAGGLTVNEPATIGAADYLIAGVAQDITLGSANMKWVLNSIKTLEAGKNYVMRVTRWSGALTTVSVVEVEA